MSLFRKSTCLIASALIFWCSVGYGQSEITGKWLSPDGDRKIEIHENNGSYSGKIIWLKNTAARVKVGDIVLTDITYKNDRWTGKAYMPARDRHVNVSIRMPGKDELEITGKVGVISQKKLWERCK